MVKLSLAGSLVVAVVCTACGGSPTSPQSLDAASTKRPDVAGAPAPAPPPADPAPPAPAPGGPGPKPDPAPPSDSVETWNATVDVQRASSPDSALPAAFTVTVRGDQMHFGPLEVTILARDGHHIYARKGQGLTIQIDDDKWTVTSVDVFAAGTISYTAP